MAEVLLHAEDTATAQTSILAQWDGLDLPTAYAAQDIALHMRLARSEKLTGVKLGVTSKAKQRQVGVSSPGTAWLTDRMILPIGEPVPFETMIQPRAEPEIAFVMGDRLSGPGLGAGGRPGGREACGRRYRDHRQPVLGLQVLGDGRDRR